MPVSEKAISDQIRRFMRLPFAPDDKDKASGLSAEFKRILHQYCVSNEHCAAVGDAVVNAAMRCPPPAEVLAACENTPAPEKTKAPMGCEVCQGSGWRHFEKEVSPPGVKPYMADVCAFCDCSLGQWKKNMEKARKDEARARAMR